MHIFPVTESTLSATSLAQFVQKQYGGTTSISCRLLRTGINHTYLITDAATTFVLRVYNHGWRTKEEISEEVRLLLHLKDNGVPVSFPIADVIGEFVQEINAPEGMRYAVLFSCAEGKKEPKFSPTASHTLGVTMANLHQRTKDFNLGRVTYTTRTLVTNPLQTIVSFFNKDSEEIWFLTRLANYLENEIEKNLTSEHRTGAIHLDIWFDNIHFKDEEHVTIFDFDFCGNGSLCFDVAYFLYQLYWTNPEEAIYLAKANAFLEGYSSVAALTPEEQKIFPVAALSVILFYLSVQCDRFDTWSNVFLNEDHLKRNIGFMKKWIAYHQIPIE